jgi:hypothetical protein
VTAESTQNEQENEITVCEPDEALNVQHSATGEASLDSFQRLLDPINELLRRIEHRIDGVRAESPTCPPADLSEFVSGLKELRHDFKTIGTTVVAHSKKHFKGVAQLLADFRTDVTTRLDTLAEPASAQSTETEVPEDEWSELVLGRELAENPELESVRKELIDDVKSGHDKARTLAGNIMLVQSAPVDQIPKLMRDVGEAYYQWRPRSSSMEEPFEKALASWLTKRASNAGLRNSIELVCPGDRFDSARHLASEPGVQVVAVHGWVVLRDNGKVFTKANVTVR